MLLENSFLKEFRSVNTPGTFSCPDFAENNNGYSRSGREVRLHFSLKIAAPGRL